MSQLCVNGFYAINFPNGCCIRDSNTMFDYKAVNGVWEIVGSIFDEINSHTFQDDEGYTCTSSTLIPKPTTNIYNTIFNEVNDIHPLQDEWFEDIVGPPSPPKMGRPSTKDSSDNQVKKRDMTQYNMFVKNEMADIVPKYKPSERMHVIANLWKEYNNFIPGANQLIENNNVQYSNYNESLANLWDQYKNTNF